MPTDRDAHPSTPTSGEFAIADAALNNIYRDLIAAAASGGSEMGGELNASNSRAEQRAWLAYRDALAAFGKTLAPDLPATALTLRLTKDGTAALEEVYTLSAKNLAEQKH